MAIRVLQNAFNAGEVSPSMYGRIDDQKFAMGCATLRNFICQPQGPATRRPGFAFVREVKDSSKKVRLIPFRYNSDQTMVLEFGHHYVRFHTYGATLLDDDGIPVKVDTPYDEDDLFDIAYEQSADVMTLAHVKYPPAELKRTLDGAGNLQWVYSAISFTSEVSAPTITSVTNTYTGETGQYIKTDRYTVYYKVTAVKDTADGVVESAASAESHVNCNLYLNDSSNTIEWNAVTGADRYRVYKTYAGLYGFIGETEETSFVDNNKAADEGVTPPRWDTVFNAAGEYPGAVAYYEQRRCFAGSINRPKMIWMTRPGTEKDFSYRIPTQDDDRIRFNIAAQEVSRILHLVPLSQLIILNASSELRVQSVNSDALTASSFSVKPQAYVGASKVHPQVFNSVLLYVADRGSHIRELGYSQERGGFTSGDLSVRAAHLFENDVIVDIALQKTPDQILWAATRSGRLLGMTYMPDQNVVGWHQHDTDGLFESVCCVPEGDEDVVYAVIKRSINGVEKRYVERMHERYFPELKQCFYVDCGNEYVGTPVSTISGLSYLEGKEVSILADGGVVPNQVVEDGSITLDTPASRVVVGLPYASDLKTLPAHYQLQDGSYGRGHMKNVNKLFVRVYQSSGIEMGPDFDRLLAVKSRQNEAYGTPPDLRSAEIPMAVQPHWSDSGQVAIRQKFPLPLTVVGITADLAQ